MELLYQITVIYNFVFYNVSKIIFRDFRENYKI